MADPIGGGGAPIDNANPVNRADNDPANPPQELGERNVPAHTDGAVADQLKKPKNIKQMAKSVGKFMWKHKVLFSGLGIAGLGAAVLIGVVVVAPVPSLSLLLLGVGLMIGGVGVAIWAGPLEPIADSGIDKLKHIAGKGADLVKAGIRHVGDTEAGRHIKEKFQEVQRSAWDNITGQVGDGGDFEDFNPDDFDIDDEDLEDLHAT